MRTIFSDLDGVLWFSESLHKNAFRQVLQNYVDNAEIVLQKTWNFGESTESYFQRIMDLGFLNSSEISIPELMTLKREFAKDLSANPQLLNTELIEILLDLKKYPLNLALISSSSQENVHNFLKLSNLESFFDLIVDNTQVKDPKPSPECYLLALELLDVNIKNVIAIEDSESGIVSAERAGLTNIIKYPSGNIRDRLFNFVLGVN